MAVQWYVEHVEAIATAFDKCVRVGIIVRRSTLSAMGLGAGENVFNAKRFYPAARASPPRHHFVSLSDVPSSEV